MNEMGNKGLLSNLKILYVEDEELTRNELSVFLKRRVGRLFIAKNGEEGLTMFLENKPDVILTDLKMPVMGGMELLEEIRKTGSKCPAIVISALSDSETIVKTVDLGIVKYAIKPLNTDELIKQIENMAVDILKMTMGETVVGGLAILNKEDKYEFEKKLKSEIAAFLKTYTGKGPRDVQVFIKGNRIEVKASGVLTLIEVNLVVGKRNYSLVDFNRKLFYEENAYTFEKKLGEALAIKVKLLEVKADSENNIDTMTFSIL